MKRIKTYSIDGTRKDLEEAAKLVTQIKKKYPARSKERRLLLLIKDASFFVYLYHGEDFIKFLRRADRGLTGDQLKKLERMGVVTN